MKRLTVPLTYWFWRHVFWLLLNTSFRMEVTGAQNLPPDGPVIVVSNHLAAADPTILAASLSRRLVFMVKLEMARGHWYSPIIRAGGMVAVRRFEADLAALRRAKEVLQRGGVLAMFPEGTRSRTSRMGPGHPGTALIALQTATPIVPVGISGSECIKSPASFFHRYPIRVNVGPPIHLTPARRPSAETIRESTDIVMRKIADLLPPSYRGAYGATPPQATVHQESVCSS